MIGGKIYWMADQNGELVDETKDGFVLLCPYHDDRPNPSLWVNPRIDAFKCRSCGVSGGYVELAGKYGWELPPPNWTDPYGLTEPWQESLAGFPPAHKWEKPAEPRPAWDCSPPPPVKEPAPARQFPEAVEYLRKRGYSEASIDQARAARTFIVDQNKNKTQDVLCMAFCYRNREGDLLRVKFRAIDPNPDLFKQQRIHPGGLPPERLRTWYGLEKFEPGKDAIVVEGEHDCDSLVQMGYSNVLSLPTGAQSTLTNEQWDLLRESEHIYLAVDADAAGERAANKITLRFDPGKCFRVRFHDQKDANAALQAGWSRADFDKAIEEAKPIEKEEEEGSSRIPGEDDGDEPQPGINPDTKVSEPTMLSVPINEFINSCSETVDYIIEPYLPKTGLLIIGGPTKSGKTWFAAWLTCGIVAAGMRVLFVEEEGPKETLAERFAPFLRKEFHPRIHILHRKGYLLDDASSVDRLIAEMEGLQANVLVLDPLNKLHRHIRQNGEVPAEAIQSIERIIRETGCSIILLGHTRKGVSWDKNKNEEAQSADFAGSYAWAASADNIIQIKGVPLNERFPGEVRFWVENPDTRHGEPLAKRLAVVRLDARGEEDSLTWDTPDEADGKPDPGALEQMWRHIPEPPEFIGRNKLLRLAKIGTPRGSAALKYYLQAGSTILHVPTKGYQRVGRARSSPPGGDCSNGLTGNKVTPADFGSFSEENEATGSQKSHQPPATTQGDSSPIRGVPAAVTPVKNGLGKHPPFEQGNGSPPSDWASMPADWSKDPIF